MFGIFQRKNNRYVVISPSIVIFTAIFGFGLYFIFQISSILTLLFISFILMVALNPSVNKIQKKTKKRGISIGIVYIALLIIGVALFTFLIPPLVNQLYQLIKTIDIPFLQEQINGMEFNIKEIGDLVDRYGSSVNALLSFIGSTFTSAFTIVTMIVMTFYLLLDRPNLHLKLSWFTKKKSYIRVAEKFLNDLEIELGGWVRGETILMTIIGLGTFVGLAIMQIPFAIPLAILAGLLEILPNLGPTIAAIPAIIIAFFYRSPGIGVGVTIFYILIQQLENSIIVPKVFKKNVNVNPLISILSILIGAKLAGVTGAFLAIPTYIVLRTVYSYWYRYKDKLNLDF